GLAVGKGRLSLAAWERLSSVTAEPMVVDVGAELRRLRARKTPEEIALLERAAQLTDEVTAGVLAEMGAGRSELEVAAGIDLRIASAGGQRSFATIAQSGPNSALPHLRPTGRRLQPGDLVLLDFGAAWAGYKADTTRVAVIGEPDARQREL